MKGKLLKPLGQEVAERGCFLWQSRGVVRAGPTSCLGPRRQGRTENPSFLVSNTTKKMEALIPPDWRGALSEEVKKIPSFCRERNFERRADLSAKRKGGTEQVSMEPGGPNWQQKTIAEQVNLL